MERYYTARDNTLSDDNVNGAVPYFDGDGDLCISCVIYNMSTAFGGYQTDLVKVK